MGVRRLDNETSRGTLQIELVERREAREDEMSEQKRPTLNLGRILGNALAEAQKPRIVAECWTCRGLTDARGVTQADATGDPARFYREQDARMCRDYGHDVRPVELQKGDSK